MVYTKITKYREYLALHFGKYIRGKLPDMPAVFTMQNETEQYTMSFKNALDDRTCKYIKPCMQLIKVKKTRKARTSVDVLAQAEGVVRRTRTHKIANSKYATVM